MEPILDELRAQGWDLRITSRNHIEAVPPDPTRSIVILVSKPKSWCSIGNALRDLRRSGFVWSRDRRQGRAERSTPPAPPHPRTPAERGPSELDRLHREIVEARQYLELANEQLAERGAEMEKALLAFEAAKDERVAALRQVVELRRRRDRLRGAR